MQVNITPRDSAGLHIVGARYRVVARVGAGSSAEVFDALDVVTQRRVALKVYRVAGTRPLRVALREAALLAELSHPNLATGYAAGECGDGRPYVAMEWVNGKSLADIQSERALQHAEVVALGLVLASALHAVHTAGIFYGDLKPANILIPIDAELAIDQLKLIDFGVAKHMQYLSRSGALHIAPGRVAGTPLYMAPEQLQGRAHGAPAEVFALAALLFDSIFLRRQLCQSRIPRWDLVLSDDEPPLQIPIVVDRILKPIQIPQSPEIPPGLRRTLETGLRMRPEDRFASMLEFRSALSNSIQDG